MWTSTLQRTIQTAQHLPYNKLTWKSLDELDPEIRRTYEKLGIPIEEQKVLAGV